MRWVLAAIVVSAVVAGVVYGAHDPAGDDRAPAQHQLPPTEHVLLGAPDPRGPERRGVFVADPHGQIERIAAIGHLVAWSVRTPADPVEEDDDSDLDIWWPRVLPERSVVLVADERGGEPLRLDLGKQWVNRLRMLRGPGGEAEPQLAVESCVDRYTKHCTTQLFTLAADPLRRVDRSTGPLADAAVAGRIESGRRVIAGTRRGRAGGAGGCAPRLWIAGLDGTGRRPLPPVRFDGGLYTRCTHFERAELHGRYAFAWVEGKAVGADYAGIEGTTVAAIDVDAGPRAHWRAVQRPIRESDYSTGVEIGPALTDSAMYWEEIGGDIDDNSTYSFELVALPRDLHPPARNEERPTTAGPITPDATTACDLAATTDAVYELTNARCRMWPEDGGPIGGAIRRITHPVFWPDAG